jgi:hypothetical protein
MAVTKQTYTAAATWTASQLADIFRSAFIDAGLMTDWFDSFTNTGIENRVLRVINDGSKTYGTVFYWFMFTTAGAYIQTTLGWNAATDVPSGTLFLDYYSTATNTVGNHRQFFAAVNTTTVTLTRYTSAINTNCTWFLPRQGAVYSPFLIPYGTYNATALVDQNRVAFNGAVRTVGAAYSSLGTQIIFCQFAGHTRRTFMGATFLRAVGADTTVYLNNSFPASSAYAVVGNVTGQGVGNATGAGLANAVILPTSHVNTNTALATDSTPVYTSIMASAYLPALPSDFGMAPYYASNAIAIQDTLVVTAASEEWEMITVTNNTTADAGRTVFLARIVG